MSAPDFSGALWQASPNFGPRRDGALPSLVVIHYTAMQSAEAALERLCDPLAEVSAHYLIAEDGRIWQMVREQDRAWHAGAGSWGAVGDVNSHSIGIELANTGRHPFPEPQFSMLEQLLAQILDRWTIPASGVIGHSDMAPERKFDPGPRFDWRRLARAGLSIWPENGPKRGAADGEFWDLATRFGYGDWDRSAVLAAFRARFRPEVREIWPDGEISPPSRTDIAILADLVSRSSVDPGTTTD
ncbi:MAG: N-acetylmuramoyl-L-alanine amidase [Mangrovicoccus sp.]